MAKRKRKKWKGARGHQGRKNWSADHRWAVRHNIGNPHAYEVLRQGGLSREQAKSIANAEWVSPGLSTRTALPTNKKARKKIEKRKRKEWKRGVEYQANKRRWRKEQLAKLQRAFG